MARWTMKGCLAAAAVLLWVGPAVAQEQECESDADCDEGQFCAATPCAVPDCAPEDPDCPVDWECTSYCLDDDDGSGWDSDCETDADCGDGFVCEVVGGSDCAFPTCPEGEPCPDPEPCESEEFYGCVPAPCDSDADCGDGMICFQAEWEACTGEDVPACPPDTECPEPEPTEPECDTHTETFCAPPYVGGCEVDADCGEGFSCVEEESCWCSGSSGSGSSGLSGGGEVPPDSGGDPDVPDEEQQEDPDFDEPDCGCEFTGDYYCEPNEIDCTDDADCPSDWTCVEYPSTGACTFNPDTGEERCEESDDGGAYCEPPYWGGWGGTDSADGGAGYEEGVDRATGGEAGGDANVNPVGEGQSDDGDATRPGNSSDGGCTVASTSTRNGLGALGALALGMLVTRRRRR